MQPSWGRILPLGLPPSGQLLAGSVFEVVDLTSVELWGFEPQTSCIPSSGNPSTEVHQRRSPPLQVPAVHRNPDTLRYFAAVRPDAPPPRSERPGAHYQHRVPQRRVVPRPAPRDALSSCSDLTHLPNR